MRGDDGVPGVQQRVGGVERRLLLKDIDARTGQLAAVQGVGHRLRVDHRPARGVDEVGPVLHPGDGVLVNQVSGLIVERAVQRDDVALLEQLVQRDKLDAAAQGGGIGMGIVGAKAAEGISRQPEAEGKIRTTLMLDLVFIETAVIYALLVVILILFVL